MCRAALFVNAQIGHETREQRRPESEGYEFSARWVLKYHVLPHATFLWPTTILAPNFPGGLTCVATRHCLFLGNHA
jgi:hypothetical protein